MQFTDLLGYNLDNEQTLLNDEDGRFGFKIRELGRFMCVNKAMKELVSTRMCRVLERAALRWAMQGEIAIVRRQLSLANARRGRAEVESEALRRHISKSNECTARPHKRSRATARIPRAASSSCRGAGSTTQATLKSAREYVFFGDKQCLVDGLRIRCHVSGHSLFIGGRGEKSKIRARLTMNSECSCGAKSHHLPL